MSPSLVVIAQVDNALDGDLVRFAVMEHYQDDAAEIWMVAAKFSNVRARTLDLDLNETSVRIRDRIDTVETVLFARRTVYTDEPIWNGDPGIASLVNDARSFEEAFLVASS